MKGLFVLRLLAVAIFFPAASVAVAFWWQYLAVIADTCIGLFSWDNYDPGAQALRYILYVVSMFASVVLVLFSIIQPLVCDPPGPAAPKPPSE